jgi:L-fuculose-phosphate aldolase
MRDAPDDDAAVIDAARGLLHDGLVVGTVGNVSVRRGDRVRITPTRVPYERMTAQDLVTVEVADGRIVLAPHPPSRELPLHLAVYRARPDVGAIVHTHSPYAVAWSFGGRALAPELEEQRYYGIGPVRVCGPSAAGTRALALAAVRALGRSRAVLLPGHGVVAVGDDPGAAAVCARVVEHHAQIAFLFDALRR